MERAREVSRARPGARVRAAADAGGGHVHVDHEDVLRFAREAGFRTRFVGYESTETDTMLRVAEGSNGWLLVKLAESPFYPEGGGQVSDSGTWRRPRAGPAWSTFTGSATTRPSRSRPWRARSVPA